MMRKKTGNPNLCRSPPKNKEEGMGGMCGPAPVTEEMNILREIIDLRKDLTDLMIELKRLQTYVVGKFSELEKKCT